MAIYELTESIPSKISKSDILNCSYSGNVVSIELPKGKYKLECWGAQGGSIDTYYGGYGGYSYGTLKLVKNTILYLRSGGQPNTVNVVGNVSGGYNGGGMSYVSLLVKSQGGGGGTDIRINNDDLFARVIVAGGGSGSEGINNATITYGGGTLSGAPKSNLQASQTSAGSNASFGIGANSAAKDFFTPTPGGGGGGWYGGGTDPAGNKARSGGGSGYVYTADTASNYPEGCLLNSSYYLTDAETIAGNQSIISPSGATTTGNSGNGYIRITVIELDQLSLYIKENSAWTKGNKLYEKNNGIWEILESSQIENTINAKKIKKPKYVWKKFENEEDNHTLLLISDTLEDKVGGHSITNNGVVLNTNQSKFGGSSLYFGGSQYMDIPLEIASSSDFTVDYWAYQTDTVEYPTPFELYSTSVTRGYYNHAVSASASNKIYLCAPNNSIQTPSNNEMSNLLNKWTHYAVVKNNTNLILFVNGVNTISFTLTEVINIDKLGIGAMRSINTTISEFYGYIDEFRVSNIARWTENFTPPTEPYNYTLIGYIESENSNAYPANGLADDGYYYKKL